MDTNLFTIYDSPQKSQRFKKALINIRGPKCEKCQNTHWLNQPINLEVHHKNGDRCDNTLENLSLLCPNCHSYTENYGSKNRKIISVSDETLAEALIKSFTIREALITVGLSDTGTNYNRARKILQIFNISLLQKEKENFCIDCNTPITPGSIRCKKCNNLHQQTISITREELKHLIRTTPFTAIGKKYGVSDNAIRKWCDKYNLPRKSSEIKKISDSDWDCI